jgi:Spy/CpxP family protein refolding chaperone
MKRTLSGSWLVVCLAVVVVGKAQAYQGPNLLFGGLGGLDMILQNDGVKRELKLSDEQNQKVKEVIRDVRLRHREDWEKLKDLSPEERREKLPELIKVDSDDAMTGLGKVLSPDQVKRLKQIKWQNDGLRAFSDEEIIKTLSLSADQRQKIKSISEDARHEFAAIFQPAGDASGGSGIQEGVRKIAILRRDTLEKAVNVLNPSQKKQWKQLIGEPFEVKIGASQRKSSGAAQ